MFNPEADLDYSSFYLLLGNFFKQLDNEQKKQIQLLFKGYGKLASSAFYSLYNAQSSRFLDTEGFIEAQLEKYRLYTTGYYKNTEEKYLSNPRVSAPAGEKQLYKITAYNLEGETNGTQVQTAAGNVTLSWLTVEEAVGYRVYKQVGDKYKLLADQAALSIAISNQVPQEVYPPRKNEALVGYQFLLPEKWLYLYSECRVNGQVEPITLQQTLFFPKQKFINGYLELELNYIALVRVLSLWLPLLGFSLNQVGIKYTTPFALSGEALAKANARHLLLLFKLISFYLRQTPTLQNLRYLWGLYCGVPFAYEAGEVTSLSPLTIGEKEYSLNNFSTTLQIGDQVQQYQLLSEEAQVHDFISNSAAVSFAADPEMALAFSSPYIEDGAVALYFIQNLTQAGLEKAVV